MLTVLTDYLSTVLNILRLGEKEKEEVNRRCTVYIVACHYCNYPQLSSWSPQLRPLFFIYLLSYQSSLPDPLAPSVELGRACEWRSTVLMQLLTRLWPLTSCRAFRFSPMQTSPQTLGPRPHMSTSGGNLDLKKKPSLLPSSMLKSWHWFRNSSSVLPTAPFQTFTKTTIKARIIRQQGISLHHSRYPAGTQPTIHHCLFCNHLSTSTS